MSKRKREATDGEAMHGLKKVRRDPQNSEREEHAEGDGVIVAQPVASMNGHAIATGQKTEAEKQAAKLARKLAKREKRRREKERKLELLGAGNSTVDVAAEGHAEGDGVIAAQPVASVNGHAIATGQKTEAEKQAAKLARKLARREKRRREKERKVELLGAGNSTVDVAAAASKTLERLSNKAAENGAVRAFEDSAWRVSDAVGGRLLDLDPLFSSDEKYLFLAYDMSIHVFSTSTSLLTRKLSMSKSGAIVGFVLSPTDANLLYVATSSGSIYRYDWNKGKNVGRWDISSQIFNLTGSDSAAAPSERDILYTVDKKGQWMITAHRLSGKADASQTELRTLLKSPEPLTALKVLAGGKIIVATSGSHLMIGCSDPASPPSLNDLSYVWREISCPEWITSIDVRVPSVASQAPGSVAVRVKSSNTKGQGPMDVVVGDLKGSIFVYEDLLGKLIRKERHGESVRGQDLTPQQLHWHRNGVSTTKWSLDGNYVISGGLETVLILWQLETGRQQQLPHLSAAIEAVVVSPSGLSYAIRLADNSAMVLSTTELQPTTSISGIQVPTSAKPLVALPQITTVDSLSQESTTFRLNRLPSVVNPVNPGQLLLAVPTSSCARLSSTVNPNAAQLQTLDIATAHQVSRQALARTNVTVRNMGPEANMIEEPCVRHMQVSCDGQWLATVDEWQPPKRDIAHLAFDDQSTAQELDIQLEVHLKFWSWNIDLRTWELVARIDNPHPGDATTPRSIGKVLDLVSDPSSVGFATIADDNTVRIWTPRMRYRNGVQVRGKDGKNLTNWSCSHIVPLVREAAAIIENSEHLTACLAYSQDGSLLAAGSSNSASKIHLIDMDSGKVRYTRTGLFTGRLMGLGMVDRYMIMLSNELGVWDLVDDELHYGLSVKSYGLSAVKETASTHLVVHPRNHTFAIALPAIGHSSKSTTKLGSKIAVFDPENPTPLFVTTLRHTVISLLPATERKGYYAIDSAAEVRVLTPIAQSDMAPLPAPAIEDVPLAGLENIYGAAKGTNDAEDIPLDTKAQTLDAAFMIEEDGDTPVFRHEDLAGIFDIGPSFTLPPVVDLFEQVAALCSR